MSDPKLAIHSTWRQALARWLLGIDINALFAGVAQLQCENAAGRDREAELRVIHAQLHNTRLHLAALQGEYDRFKVAGLHDVSAQRLTEAERHLSSLAAVHEWMKAAEVHLASLQAGYAHLESIVQRQNDQLMRAIARAALLDSRLGDLEQADTAIAAAIAKTGSSHSLE